MLGEIPWIFVRVINESSGMESGAMAGVGGWGREALTTIDRR